MVTKRNGKYKHDDLTSKEEQDPKSDIAQGPSIIQGIGNKKELRGQIDQDACPVENEINHPESNWISVVKGTNVVKRRHANETNY
jgi:hypothetical protein